MSYLIDPQSLLNLPPIKSKAILTPHMPWNLKVHVCYVDIPESPLVGVYVENREWCGVMVRCGGDNGVAAEKLSVPKFQFGAGLLGWCGLLGCWAD